MAILGAQKIFLALSLLNPGGGGCNLLASPINNGGGGFGGGNYGNLFWGKKKGGRKNSNFPLTYLRRKKKGFAFKRKFSPFSRKRGEKNITAYFAYRRLFSSFSGKRGSRLDFYPRKKAGRGRGGRIRELFWPSSSSLPTSSLPFIHVRIYTQTPPPSLLWRRELSRIFLMRRSYCHTFLFSLTGKNRVFPPAFLVEEK